MNLILKVNKTSLFKLRNTCPEMWINYQSSIHSNRNKPQGEIDRKMIGIMIPLWNLVTETIDKEEFVYLSIEHDYYRFLDHTPQQFVTFEEFIIYKDIFERCSMDEYFLIKQMGMTNNIVVKINTDEQFREFTRMVSHGDRRLYHFNAYDRTIYLLILEDGTYTAIHEDDLPKYRNITFDEWKLIMEMNK